MSNAEWITDRLPTEADGDMDGDVRMVPAPHADSDDYLLVHWSYVGDAAPWQRTDCWKPLAEPTPTEPTPTEPTPTEPTATPQPDWAALGWITHRQPTAKDADGLGQVVVPSTISATPRTGDARCSGFRLIVPGQPWWSQYASEPGHPTAPSVADRIVALERGQAELEATMRQLLHGSRFRLVVEPR